MKRERERVSVFKGFGGEGDWDEDSMNPRILPEDPNESRGRLQRVHFPRGRDVHCASHCECCNPFPRTNYLRKGVQTKNKQLDSSFTSAKLFLLLRLHQERVNKD